MPPSISIRERAGAGTKLKSGALTRKIERDIHITQAPKQKTFIRSFETSQGAVILIARGKQWRGWRNHSGVAILLTSADIGIVSAVSLNDVIWIVTHILAWFRLEPLTDSLEFFKQQEQTVVTENVYGMLPKKQPKKRNEFNTVAVRKKEYESNIARVPELALHNEIEDAKKSNTSQPSFGRPFHSAIFYVDAEESK